MRLCLETFHCRWLEDGCEGARRITRCSRGKQRWVSRFGSDRCFHRFELTKFESICLRKQQSQPRLLGSIIFHRIPRVCVCVLSRNASSGLPEEHLPGLPFEHEFRFHDVSMHLGGLNPLMRCHEQRKARNLTARFNANTPLRLPHLHIPRRSVYREGAVPASNAR